MIDLFTLALTHSLMALALVRLLYRPELDVEGAVTPPRRPWVKDAPEPAEESAGDA